MPIQLKRNDTKDVIGYSITHADGTAVNLTGATVRFIMGKGKTLLTNASATIVDAATGKVEYTLTENDTLAAGVFNAEFEVTFGDGKIKTYPNNGYISVSIQANIDKDKSTYSQETQALYVSQIELFKTEINEKVAITQQLIDGSFDDGLLKTNIEEKLNNLEVQYAPTLTGLESQMAQIANKIIDVKNPPKNLTSAKGDGVTDDTTAINAIVQYVKTNKLGGLYFPDSTGAYMIRATGTDSRGDDLGGIIIDTPMEIHLHPNAKLKAITGSKNGYTVLNIKNTKNVTVIGGTILGERTTHIGTTGEHGFGIRITSSKNIMIKNISIFDCWGDGIILRPDLSNPSSYCEDIYIQNVVCDNNRRQGLTIGNGYRIFVSNSQFNRTNGISPESGIDIENDPGYLIPKDIFINDCLFDSNKGFDVVFGYDCENVFIHHNKMIGSSTGIGLNTDRTVKNLIIDGNNIKPNGHCITITGNPIGLSITNNLLSSTSVSGDGIYLDAALTDIHIEGNQIKTCFDGIFIGNHAVSKFTIKGNEITNVNRFIFIYNTTLYDSIINDNMFIDAKNIGFGLRLVDSIISGNKFKDVARDGMIGSPVRCLVEGNQLINMGTEDPLNYRSIAFDSVTASDNFILGNYIRHSNTAHIGIRAFLAPSALPSVFSKNNCRYGAGVISLNAAHINDGNFTL